MDTATDIKKEDKKGSYRDSVATITKEGNRNFINPKKPKGKLYNLRTRFSIFYLAVFFTLPFIKVNEEPLLMFNILERKFIIFGLIFWPQDFLFSVLPCSLSWYLLFYLPWYLAGYFVAGPAHKPFLWKWFSGKLNIGLMAMLLNKNN